MLERRGIPRRPHRVQSQARRRDAGKCSCCPSGTRRSGHSRYGGRPALARPDAVCSRLSPDRRLRHTARGPASTGPANRPLGEGGGIHVDRGKSHANEHFAGLRNGLRLLVDSRLPLPDELNCLHRRAPIECERLITCRPPVPTVSQPPRWSVRGSCQRRTVSDDGVYRVPEANGYLRRSSDSG